MKYIPGGGILEIYTWRGGFLKYLPGLDPWRVHNRSKQKKIPSKLLFPDVRKYPVKKLCPTPIF